MLDQDHVVLDDQRRVGVSDLVVFNSDYQLVRLGDLLMAGGSVTITNPVTLGTGSAAIGTVGVTGSVAVTGTFYQTIQPVSASSLPLPTGAGTAANQSAILTAIQTGSAFQPVAAATVALTVGPASTAAPIALAAATASAVRVRNASISASPVAWRMTTTATAAVLPGAYSSAGTGGTAGDNMIDPGGVEIFGLTVAQQAALAAGTLYLAAITPSGGSATIYVTPGSGT